VVGFVVTGSHVPVFVLTGGHVPVFVLTHQKFDKL
jgi:hypothetical protein